MVSTRLMSIVSETLTEIYCQGSSTDVVPRVTRSAAIASTSEANNTNRPSASTSSLNLLDLPQEIVERILGFLHFKNVCQLRLACRTMDRICGQLLNSTFQRLQTQMLNRFQNIKSKMPRRESARRNHHLACESDIIETLYMRLTLLQMSFGKHIERKHCCFFPGEILDEVYNILRYIKVTPKLARPYKVTDELFDLSTMAMEYFKEKIEPELPEIAYFGTDFLDLTSTFSSSGTNKYLALDSSPLGPEETKESDQTSNDVLDSEDLVGPLPQSNMVLRKRIRKIKQGMKRYNSQLSLLRQDLRSCRRKTAEQQKQISEQQKQLAEQQKQTLEYATRLDEYDKKNEEISRKFSTLLQELNKCKTELQYWRSKSPATPPFCTGCGNVIASPPEEIQALMNQGVIPEGLDFDSISEFIPIAGTSGTENDEAAPEISTTKSECSPKKEAVKAVAAAAATTATPVAAPGKNGKRKMAEDTPVSAPTSKKPRRVPKVRSKRVKL